MFSFLTLKKWKNCSKWLAGMHALSLHCPAGCLGYHKALKLQWQFKGKLMTAIMSWHYGKSSTGYLKPVPLLGFHISLQWKPLEAFLLKSEVQCNCFTSSKDSPKYLGAQDKIIFIHVKMESLILHCLSLVCSLELECSFHFAKTFISNRSFVFLMFSAWWGNLLSARTALNSKIHKSTDLLGVNRSVC